MADIPTSFDAEKHARILYDYHRLNMPIQPSAEAIFTLCSFDLRVAHRAVDIFNDAGKRQYLIFSGRYGKHTANLFTKPEAEVFADVALERGVPRDKIILETESTNTGENVRFTYNLLKSMGLSPRRLILVQSPYMERRTYATFRRQWPDASVQFSVTSPQLSFDQYPCSTVSKEVLVTSMIETLIRIKEYPERGFQILQDIPDEV
ncbi:DUF218 domain-containing protein [Diaporthe helianthi]|uniref:DUF218 domain-containing protein n=1 Tax=Diaporthe helianthi TaxID=158607 RepID=A0A2P5I622_DIAHE|nr:DUF218 domain-containing protein [Diaporthe helianthi]